MLETRPQVLYATVIRSADVVGATCIGIATDARFEDLDFDLVIADEAGQIQVMDLLVPLVRARRAVLVGDHLQLPPVVEPELVQKIREKEPENQELGQWLEKSLFERLILRPELPESHKVMLDTQYRMPRQIADFISGQFYGGKYQTGIDPAHSDPIFSNPLVFVDTMKEVRHYEQHAGENQGYTNPTEARIIADLLLAYQSEDIQAGVIVPYRKQAEAIRRELRQRGTGWDEDVLASQVATVDSFQGREQDVVLFGFTRSNPDGRVGFLSELRRLNVSLTRARRQLVLVGDSVTLSNAHDPAFARLFTALLLRVKKTPRGYLSSHEVARIISKS
jgi:superfamily I DNA and/or RNA helicase